MITLALVLPLSLLALLNTWLIQVTGWPLDANALNLVFETNIAEAHDLLSSLPGVHFVCTILALTGAAFLSLRYRPRSREVRLLSRRVSVYSGLALAATIFLTSPDQLAFDSSFNEEQKVFRLDPADGQRALRASYPAGLPVVISDFLASRSELDTAVDNLKAFTFGADRTRHRPERQVYILVIGETTRAGNLGLNGYNRDTTPRLEQREGLLSLTRMFTLHTFTRLSVPVILTRKPLTSLAAIFHEASILTAFKEAGFQTAWISTQAPLGYHESPVTIHAREAHTQRFLNLSDYRTSGLTDAAVIPEVKKILAQHDNQDQFIVVHLLGSHFRYTDRYPSDFSHFRPDRPVNRHAKLMDVRDKVFLVNSYDNSIRYQDYVLDNLIQTLVDQPDTASWMFYVSDHGESLFDDCRGYAGHGMAAHATQHVAALFWSSPKFLENDPELVANMTINANKLTSTSMMFETLSDLGGLDVPGNRLRNSIASDQFDAPGEIIAAAAPEKLPCE